MIIKDKLDLVLKTMTYDFCGMTFTIMKSDLIRIYKSDKDNLLPLYQCRIEEISSIPQKYLISNYEKEDLYKIDYNKYAVCFYINKENKVEKPISAQVYVK